MRFFDKLDDRVRACNSILCIGLDPDSSKLPQGLGIMEFNRKIINATSEFCCAYKLNFAFYEAAGAEGLNALKETVKMIPGGIPVIADAKRADIGNTSRAYASAIFDYLGFDAATVNPYMGFDSLQPFIERDDRGIFILCRTSNPGAADFQDLFTSYSGSRRAIFELVAGKADEWNSRGNIGLVMGATHTDELSLIRKELPEMPFLVPGVGAQGGELAAVVESGKTFNPGGLIINSSRQIIFASSGPYFSSAAAEAARSLRDGINSCR
jgi:orotidine-5'-phosphate decarboxylase